MVFVVLLVVKEYLCCLCIVIICYVDVFGGIDDGEVFL